MSSRECELHILQIQSQRISFILEKLRTTEEKTNSDGWRICSLCKCPVYRAGINGYFGLLVSCSDTFCLRCIREFRQREMAIQCPFVRRLNCRQFVPEPMLCPVCKAPSLFIMASKDFKSGKSKASFTAEFKSNTESITCNFLRVGFGTCVGDRSCEEGSLKVLRNLQKSEKKTDPQKKK